jgi:hypothetical protein
MIAIFCDFRQFSAKKLALFSKTNVMINILHNLALFWVKNAIFCRMFQRKYLKIITSVQGMKSYYIDLKRFASNSPYRGWSSYPKANFCCKNWSPS